MKVIVLLNAKAGTAASTTESEQLQRVREAFSAHTIDADLRPTHGHHLKDAARRALAEKPDAVVAGGGDGTLSAVAGVLADTNVPFGILPLGTLNHFAKDLSIPLDLEKAVAIIAAGHVRSVDVAEVNGHTFVNNSSIGIYPQVVRDRDSQRERLGRGKWLAMFFAMVNALRRYPTVRVRLGVEGRTVLRTTPFVFIGNNAYEMSLFSVKGRHCLDCGQLSLYVANRPGRFGMLRLALRTALGSLNQDKDFESNLLPEVFIDSNKRHLHVAMDGEVTKLNPPLHYRTRPGALKVFAPPPPPAAADDDDMKTIAHISDLHFGRDDPPVAEGLVRDLTENPPDVVVNSGDFTQRARANQYLAARDYMNRLPQPQLVVPGNHDIPLYDVIRRFFFPLQYYRRYITTDLRPFHHDGEIAILGINTARSFTWALNGFWKDGRISEEQLLDVKLRFCDLPKETVKIVVTHHPFIPPPGERVHGIVWGARRALDQMEDCGIDIVLAGHLHMGYSGDVRTHHEAIKRSILSIQAGTGISTRRRNEPNAYNRIVIKDLGHVDIHVRAWTGQRFDTSAVTRYARIDGIWQKEGD